MAPKLTMLDYVVMANQRLRQNLAQGETLVDQLVSAYLGHLSDNGDPEVRIVASGSSYNAALCSRAHMQRSLNMQVNVTTPEAFVAQDYAYPADAFNIVISQSGYSTNVLQALSFCRQNDLSCTALTGNANAPIINHTSVVLDYGVGVESVDFVTMGVATLAEFLMLFGLYAARSLGRLTQDDLDQHLANLSQAFDVHQAMLELMPDYINAHRLDLARKAPAMLVGNGSSFGAAKEGALKFNETLKYPAMFFEGEEFAHGPEMQIVPGYHVVIFDDAAGSVRLARAASVMSQVTASTTFITANPTGAAYELAIPAIADPLATGFVHLAFVHYVAAAISQELNCWDVHPYLDAHASELDTKAGGYQDAVAALEERAATAYNKPLA